MAATCMFCGEERVCEIFEIWEGHEFQVETCCEGLHEQVVATLNDSPEEAADLMRSLGVEVLMGAGLRRVAEDGRCGLLLDFKLEVRPISRGEAREFIRAHHEHCPPPAGDRFRAAIWNGPTLVGVTMVGRPVARMLPQKSWVEVNRLCVRRDLPSALRWNACSQLYGWAAREAKRRGFEKIITYTMADEQGTTLRAAGWTDEGVVGRHGKQWNCPSRPRADKTPNVPKRRWSRMLARPARAPALRDAAAPLPMAA